MKHWMSLAFIFIFLPTAWAQSTPAHVEETLYYDFQKSILSANKALKLNGFSHFEQSLFVDALWDLLEENSPEAHKTLNEVPTLHYHLDQRLRVELLKLKYAKAFQLSTFLQYQLISVLKAPKADEKIIYLIATHESLLLKTGHKKIIELAKNHSTYFNIVALNEDAVSPQVVSDLFFRSPDLATYANGEYAAGIKLFMFCRKDRNYPCLMVMRDITGKAVRNADGSLWSHKSLALSARGYPSHTRNGHTPTGVLTIDSVMPDADQQISFGKYRRMILNFIPKSQDEEQLKSLLPLSSLDARWWRASTIARDIGRNLLRIHGTGKRNTDSSSSYFPFVPTSGCIAQRENTYNGVTYKDQRLLLDTVMEAMKLTPHYENETEVKGLLYILELDDKNEEVKLADLKIRGIE
jgi:hypothetical protein